jgi:hypothetical protein
VNCQKFKFVRWPFCFDFRLVFGSQTLSNEQHRKKPIAGKKPRRRALSWPASGSQSILGEEGTGLPLSFERMEAGHGVTLAETSVAIAGVQSFEFCRQTSAHGQRDKTKRRSSHK